MRIRELLEREPFGDILAATLEAFLPVLTGREHRVRWVEGRPVGSASRGDGQLWLCNHFLNAVFVPGVRPRVLDPVVREFGTSVSRWRRPLQRAAVGLAVRRPFSRFLAQSSLRVAPSVPRAEELLVLGGNHKIRVVDRARGVAWAVLKEGVPASHLQREVEGRRAGEQAGVPGPELQEVGDRWFREAYVLGTPANRLSRPGAEARLVGAALQALAPLTEPSLRAGDALAYARDAEEAIGRLTADGGVEPAVAEAARSLARRTRERVDAASPGGSVRTALTHGDLHPANILETATGLALIDWENWGRRQALYDPLVLFTGSRFPAGFPARMEPLLAGREPAWASDLPGWAASLWASPERHLHLLLFLLDELRFYVEEAASPLVTRTPDSLSDWLRSHRALMEGSC